VIEKNHPLSDAAHQIKPQVTLTWAQETIIFVIGHRAATPPLSGSVRILHA
jgi:hypothetical protein